MENDIQGPNPEDLNEFVLDTEAAMAAHDYTELYSLLSEKMNQSDVINSKFISKNATKACIMGAFLLSIAPRIHDEKDKKTFEAKEIDKLLAMLELHIKHYGIKDHIKLEGNPLKKYREMRKEQKIQSMDEPWRTATKISLKAPNIILKGALISMFMTTQTDGQDLQTPKHPHHAAATKTELPAQTNALKHYHP